MKVLLMSDTPSIHTGMGRVHREIGRGLKKRGFEVYSIGWFSPPWLADWPEWKVYRTQNNYYGVDVFDQVIMEVRPDIVLTIGDLWMISHIANPGQCQTRALFKWVGYIPIDGAAYHGGVPNSWEQVLLDMDQVVAYTDYGRDVILKSLPRLSKRIRKIYHGVDTEVYKPYSKEQQMDWRRRCGIADDRVIYLMVARNQFRKNIPEFCKAWKKFKEGARHPMAVFWPHMTFRDPMGWDLHEIFQIYQMQRDLVFYDDIANGESNVIMVDEQQLMKTYNMCDVFVLLAGEGFGLPTLEAMACGKPVVVLEHSANIELTQNRGIQVKVAEYMAGNHSTERPYPHIESTAQALAKLYRDPQLRLELGGRGAEYAKTMTWDIACDQWAELLKQVEDPFLMDEVPAEMVSA